MRKTTRFAAIALMITASTVLVSCKLVSLPYTISGTLDTMDTAYPPANCPDDGSTTDLTSGTGCRGIEANITAGKKVTITYTCPSAEPESLVMIIATENASYTETILLDCPSGTYQFTAAANDRYIFGLINGGPATTYSVTFDDGTNVNVPDDRINRHHGDTYAIIYPRRDDTGKSDLHIYCVDPAGNGTLGLIVTQEMFDEAPKMPSENTMVASIKCLVPISVYVLTSGEYQVNIGPDIEGKVDVVTFTGLPPTKIHYTYFNTFDISEE